VGLGIERVHEAAFLIPEFGTAARNIQQRQPVFSGQKASGQTRLVTLLFGAVKPTNIRQNELEIDG
jgi:hypothetical protein